MEFMEPPKSKKGSLSERWINIAAELIKNPNEWAFVGNFSPGVATHLRRGKYPAFLQENSYTPEQAQKFMATNWEVTTRKTDNGRRNDVFIRWVG